MICITSLTKNWTAIATTGQYANMTALAAYLNTLWAGIFTTTTMPNDVEMQLECCGTGNASVFTCNDTKACLNIPTIAGDYKMTILNWWAISWSTASGAGFSCSDGANCINTDVATQTAINNLTKTLLNLPTTAGTYEMSFNGTTYTRTTATWWGGTFTCADVEACIRTNAGTQDAINDLLFGNGNTFCDKTEDCIRTDVTVQDAIKDVVFWNGNTLCDAITLAWCTIPTPAVCENNRQEATLPVTVNQTNNLYISSPSAVSSIKLLWGFSTTNNYSDVASVTFNDVTYDYLTNKFYWIATVHDNPAGNFNYDRQVLLNWATTISLHDGEYNYDTSTGDAVFKITQQSATNFSFTLTDSGTAWVSNAHIFYAIANATCQPATEIGTVIDDITLAIWGSISSGVQSLPVTYRSGIPSMYNSGTWRVTITTTGNYEISWWAGWGAFPATTTTILIKKNWASVTSAAIANLYDYCTNGFYIWNITTTTIACVSWDYFEFEHVGPASWWYGAPCTRFTTPPDFVRIRKI